MTQTLKVYRFRRSLPALMIPRQRFRQRQCPIRRRQKLGAAPKLIADFAEPEFPDLRPVARSQPGSDLVGPRQCLESDQRSSFQAPQVMNVLV